MVDHGGEARRDPHCQTRPARGGLQETSASRPAFRPEEVIIVFQIAVASGSPTRMHLTLFVFLLTPLLAFAGQREIPLWPGTAPGEKAEIGPEQDTTKPKDNLVADRPVIRLGNVSKPGITIYPAANAAKPGPAVVVFPGGGYHILAMDLEGTEVCEWLNSIGINAVLLKYRVPKRPGMERHKAALQDAQRSVGLVRSRAGELDIDPKQIGVLGFSAGGHLAAALSASASERIYALVDDADKTSCRPDFSILIYPAYLTLKDQNDKINPETAVSS